MTKISDKSADNQSEARISVAYNKVCYMSLMTSFVKRHPGMLLMAMDYFQIWLRSQIEMALSFKPKTEKYFFKFLLDKKVAVFT